MLTARPTVAIITKSATVVSRLIITSILILEFAFFFSWCRRAQEWRTVTFDSRLSGALVAKSMRVSFRWKLFMLSRAKRAHLRHWVVPMLYGIEAIVAGLTFPRIESHFSPLLAASASVDAAIVIYSLIASGMRALTGIVFSLTFVMVQFSASAYSPRLVLWIVRDPVLSHALGIFSATFLYA